MSNDQELLDENGEKAEELSDELARKYDPERLLRLISKRAGKGESLELHIRHKYEKRFGVDLSHVRIYTGEFAEEFNKRKSAHAVTVGTTGMILMGGSADKSMASASGQALLAHELTHVAQTRRALSFDQQNAPFAQDGSHEDEAEAVEAEVANQTPAKFEPSPQQIRDAIEATKEEVKNRVIEMLTDVMRNAEHRGGSTRRY